MGFFRRMFRGFFGGHAEDGAAEQLTPQATPPSPAVSDAAAVAHQDVDRLEALMFEDPRQIEIEPVHRFADGIYAREITIPAGTLLTGKIHRTQHLNVISKGSITVWDAQEGPRLVVAPCSFVAQPGVRRVGFAHEETVWTTIHATTETDLDTLEALLIEPRERVEIASPSAVELIEEVSR